MGVWQHDRVEIIPNGKAKAPGCAQRELYSACAGAAVLLPLAVPAACEQLLISHSLLPWPTPANSADQGNRTTPSYVAFTDTERLVGDAAKNQVRE